jgi:hypothetical protein
MANASKMRIVFGAVALAFAAAIWLIYSAFVSTVATKRSPDGRHVAKLVRVQGIDVNFRVYVDGDRVYSSADFAPVPTDFREQLAWDESGQAVVLEVAGIRLFGYHAGERRPLTAEKLSKVEFTPLADLGFEGVVPGESGPRD